jgi:hypothetical protein
MPSFQSDSVSSFEMGLSVTRFSIHSFFFSTMSSLGPDNRDNRSKALTSVVSMRPHKRLPRCHYDRAETFYGGTKAILHRAKLRKDIPFYTKQALHRDGPSNDQDFGSAGFDK